MWILESYSWAAEMETVHTHMPDNPALLMKIHVSSPHEPLGHTQQRHPGRLGESPDWWPQIPHHVLGTVLSTTDMDSFYPHDSLTGGFLQVPFQMQHTHLLGYTQHHHPQWGKKSPVLRGRGKVGKSYLRGWQLRKKKKGNVLPGAQRRSWGH